MVSVVFILVWLALLWSLVGFGMVPAGPLAIVVAMVGVGTILLFRGVYARSGASEKDSDTTGLYDRGPSREEKRRPFQFDLSDLFLVFVFVASAIPVVGPSNVLFVAYLLFVVVLARVFRRTKSDVAMAGLLLAIMGPILVCCLSPIDLLGRRLSTLALCRRNIRQIGVALATYHEEHGCFPPAYIADEDGKPMHSWRVLILRYMEQKALYDAYDFDEPWDGPNNSKLAAEMPEVFRCPSDGKGKVAGMTNYVAVVGPGTAWRGGRGTKLEDIRDRTTKTILLVEVANSGIGWMEPRDLGWEDAGKGINPNSGMGMSSRHGDEAGAFDAGEPEGASVLLADGSVRFLPKGLSPEILKALLTVDGGESVGLEELDARLEELRAAQRWRAMWPRLVGLAIMILSGGMLVLRRPGVVAEVERGGLAQ